MIYTKIKGTGSYVPEKVMTNDDLAKFVDTSDEWIASRTGIRERHISVDELTVDLAEKAAIKAIENKKEIDAAKALQAEKDKLHELEEREAAIRAKEIELGLREPDEEPTDSDTGSVDNETDSDSGVSNVPDSDGSASGECNPADIETICEPHIKVGKERLVVLKKIRALVEPTDQQPDGSIDEDIAANHDGVLADIWELVDVFQ